MFIKAVITFFFIGIVNFITPEKKKDKNNGTFWKGIIILSIAETVVIVILLNLLGDFSIFIGAMVAITLAFINANIFVPLCFKTTSEKNENSKLPIGYLIYNIIAYCILFLILYYV